MAPKSRDDLIGLLQRTARENGERPLGENAFFEATKIRRDDLWRADIRNYGDLCELAGYARNILQKRKEPDELFEPLAVLTAQLTRFPDQTDREIARRKDKSFPSTEAYQTAQKQHGPLDRQLFEWCRSRPEHAKAQRLVKERLSLQESTAPPVRYRGKVVTGYVYLMRYGRGRKYKIGKSEDPPRRHSQISGMVPDDLSIVHVIETDDPGGIEGYWHQRFESKLVANKKEIFQLEPEDVAAFKRRRYQ